MAGRSAPDDQAAEVQTREGEKVGSIPPPSPELSPSDFFEASEKALSSAYRFVAFCAGITPASLEEVYKQHCKDNVQSPDDLADHEWEDDFLDEENVDEVEAQQVVQHLQEEAQLTMACASDDFELEADLQAADLGKNMPDMADLRNVIDAPQDAADCAAPFGHRNEGYLVDLGVLHGSTLERKELATLILGILRNSSDILIILGLTKTGPIWSNKFQ